MNEAEIKQAAKDYTDSIFGATAINHLRSQIEEGFKAGAKANAQKWILCINTLPPTSKKPKNSLCTNNGAVFTAFYTSGHEIEYDGEEDCPDYDEREERDGCYYLKSGWYEEVESHGMGWDTVFCHREVTGWMNIDSLPSPPNTQT